MATKITWHDLTIEEAYEVTESDPGGLSDEQARERAATGGKNILPEGRQYSRLRMLGDQFNNSLVYILLGAAIISFSLSHVIDGIFMLVVLLMNGTVGFLQEDKANRSLNALRTMVRASASVVRKNMRKEIDAADLVPGDVIMVRAGNKVPADALVIKSTRLKINESALTGEWYPIEKKPGRVAAEAPLFERFNMAFMGTTVEEGRGTLLIVATGADTEFGKIALSLKETERRQTPLQQKIARMSRTLGITIGTITAGIVVLGVMRGEPLVNMLIDNCLRHGER